MNEQVVRVAQICGVPAVSDEEAELNRESGRGPRKPRKGTQGILPISKSSWWAGVKEGRFPKPVKLGPKTTVWRLSDVLALVQTSDSDAHLLDGRQGSDAERGRK